MDEMQEIMEDFLVEAFEMIEQLDQDLVELESNPDDLDLLKDNRVNVFKSPERNDGLVGKIPNRSKVEVYEVKDLDGYKVYRIKYGKVEGWVGENVIKIKE